MRQRLTNGTALKKFQKSKKYKIIIDGEDAQIDVCAASIPVPYLVDRFRRVCGTVEIIGVAVAVNWCRRGRYTLALGRGELSTTQRMVNIIRTKISPYLFYQF